MAISTFRGAFKLGGLFINSEATEIANLGWQHQWLPTKGRQYQWLPLQQV